jgi:hypothetical protein
VTASFVRTNRSGDVSSESLYAKHASKSTRSGSLLSRLIFSAGQLSSLWSIEPRDVSHLTRLYDCKHSNRLFHYKYLDDVIRAKYNLQANASFYHLRKLNQSVKAAKKQRKRLDPYWQTKLDQYATRKECRLEKEKKLGV